MSILIEEAWDIPWAPTNEVLPGAPKWVDSSRFDIVAKTAPGEGGVSNSDIRRMLRALLIERFRMVTHYEDRLGPTYELVAAHPKLKEADPSRRTGCTVDHNLELGPALSRLIICQNTTMAQFADQLQRLALEYTNWTRSHRHHGDQGAWDFSVRFSPPSLLQNTGGGGNTADPSGAAPADPNGAISLFDALQKQLGLKLEMRKRMTPMLVIDHIEEKPTDN